MMKSLRKALLGKNATKVRYLNYGALGLFVACLLYSACMPENIEFSNEVHVEPVDLGLSVKWAPCNVGATSPEEYGGYYACGEIEEKTYYSWSTYKWCECDDDGELTSKTKYSSDIDNKTILDPEDDVARVKWGGNWRMPTWDEMKELIYGCDWMWTETNGVSGYRVTGPNGNSIFLPAAGYSYEDYISHREGSPVGYYWSVELSGKGGYCFYFHEKSFDDEDEVDEDKFLKFLGCYFGQSVRPVYGESNEEEDTSPVAVDLGLTVKWASCNVGAESPEEYGGYYAWGEVEEKPNYSWSTYKWCNGSYDSQTKYCTNSYYGTVDNKTTLDPEDDVAHVQWGGNWRMPTEAEQDELCTECSWSWTSVNGVDGYQVTGPNGNSIFLPAAGYRGGGDVHGRGTRGDYWSATLNSGAGGDYAYYLGFYDGNYYWSYYDRNNGHTVRPVTEY